MAVQSLNRAFDIVELLSQSPQGMPLSDIASGLGLPASTTFRLLATLRERGYVEQARRSGTYRLGQAFVEISGTYLNRLELRTEAEPGLRELATRTGQTVFLAIRDQHEFIYLDKVGEHSSLRKYAIIGQRRPTYATSLGKALLLDLDDSEVTALFEGMVFERYTPNTHKDVKALLQDLALCRRRGWTFDDEEGQLDIKCVAAPIHDYRSQVMAALSVSWYVSVSPDISVEEIADQATRAALEISRHMGYSQSRGRNR